MSQLHVCQPYLDIELALNLSGSESGVRPI